MRALVLAVALALVPACERSTLGDTEFHGVKLGMLPNDVRGRFNVADGQWRTVPGDGLKLEWTGQGNAGSVRRAQFEFHNGMLVAVRADLAASDASSKGPAFAASPISVQARKQADAGVSYVWIARDCPEHKAEVAGLLSAAGAR